MTERGRPQALSNSSPANIARPRARTPTVVMAMATLVPMCSARDRAWISVESPARSEEHTSELQSLMRISYAVFCLKKKKKTTSNNERDRTIEDNDHTTSYKQ